MEPTHTYVPLFEEGDERGAPAQPGHFYFDRADNGGTLYLSVDGETWTKLARGIDEPPVPHADTHTDGAPDSLSENYAPLVDGAIPASVLPADVVVAPTPLGPPVLEQ